MVTEILKKRAIKIFLNRLVQEIVESAAKEVQKELYEYAAELGVMFACITFATDGDRWQRQHTAQLATDMLTDFMTQEKYDQVAIDIVISALLETLNSDSLLENFSTS